MNNTKTYRPGFMPAPRNQWYVVAYSHEVSREPMAREVLGDDLVLFRLENGDPVALADRCAHRATALSGGKVIGDSIRCPYHGIQFGPSGKCVRVPSQQAIPGQMSVKSYPLVERWKWIWAWMGDVAAADTDLIPDHDLFRANDPAMISDTPFMMQIDCNYQLQHENLLDTTHISFLHEGQIDSGAIASADPKVVVDGNRIIIEREVEEVATGGYAQFFEFEEGTRLRRLLRTENWAPCLDIVTNIFWQPDRPDAPPRYHFSVFGITPRHLTSAYQFTGQTKNYGAHLPPQAIPVMQEIIACDKRAMESCQRSYDKLQAGAPDVSVRADEAALRNRRILTELVNGENLQIV